MARYEKLIQRQRKRRGFRVRNGVRLQDRPRLSVFRTANHLYCQVIDDAQGKTVASASTRDADLRSSLGKTGNCDAAVAVGKAVAARALAAGVKDVCFDRGRFKYHGRVAAMADAAREAGLNF